MKKLMFTILLALLAAIAPSAGSANDPYYTAASILRGEAPQDCPNCRNLTACALMRDMQNGVVLRQRWYGWRAARPQDIELMRQAATDPQFCRTYPDCRFVGNGRDLEVWARRGWASETRVIAYCGKSGCSVCVPRVPAKIQAK